MISESRLNFMLCGISGVVVGLSAMYLLDYYVLNNEGREKPVDWNGERIQKMIEFRVEQQLKQQVEETLNESCANYKLTAEDRNADGKADLRYVLEENVIVESSEDIDFDGYFETETVLENTAKLWTEVDTNNNKIHDMEIRYESNIPSTVIFRNEANGRPLKIKKLIMGKVAEANIDSDRDGLMDTAITYDEIEEIVETYSLGEHPDKAIVF